MKKVGIVTLIGYHNYGNRLQNYALKKTIEEIGYEVNSLVLEDDKGFLRLSKKEAVLETLKYGTMRDIFAKAKNVLKQKNIKPINQEKLLSQAQEKTQRIRENKFKEFTDRYLNEVKFNNDMEAEYSSFVVGSDQVWNPNNIIDKPQFFLKFTSNNKKIAYAASFGVSKLSPALHKIYKENISSFSSVSVRENEGASIVKSLTREAPQVVLDPTLLLTAKDWDKVRKQASNRPTKPYILTYFLGELSERQKEVIRIARNEKDFEIINLGQIQEQETYETGPGEFIDYIANCEFLLTDSFHGSVFSIIYKRPFIVYNRGDRKGSNDMSSRIDTLLKKFDLKGRKAKEISSLMDITNIDFTKANNIINVERDKSIQYIKDALK